MKKSIFSLLMVAGLVFIGCEKEQVEIETQQGAAKQLEVIEAGDSDTEIGLPDGVSVKAEDAFTEAFENANTWFAYYTAKTLRTEPTTRILFGTKLSADGRVSAGYLLDDSTPNLFRDKFRAYVWHKICADIQCGRPEIPKGGPSPPLNPNGEGGPTMGGMQDGGIVTMKGGGLGGYITNLDLAQQMADDYINYITNVACMEIYVPNGLNYGPAKSIFAVAHPLNDDVDNKGYEYYPILVPDSGSGFESNARMVTPALLAAGENIIISRPIDNTLIEGCGYSDYFEVADFSLFLSN